VLGRVTAEPAIVIRCGEETVSVPVDVARATHARTLPDALGAA